MLVVHVSISVKPECVAAFEEVTAANVRESLKEPGIARFDLARQMDAPTRYVLVEAYRDAEAPARHKETRHYQIWRDAVVSMMAEPRVSVKFTSLQPPDDQW
jgi:quinol monooxygenase YgiN